MVPQFFLIRNGKTNTKGMPGLLQLALLAREFEDVVQFTRPLRAIQRLLSGRLALLARIAGSIC
jgi:hypothetical protein